MRIPLLMCIVLLLLGCDRSAVLNIDSTMTAKAGHPISIEKIDTYSMYSLKFLFWMQDVPLTVEHGIVIHRVVYWTRSVDGDLVPASGLISLPLDGSLPKAALSWQHGTTSLRSAAPSDGDLFNGVFPAAVFAGHGYLLLAPDYQGFGASTEPHSYYNRIEIAGTVRDFALATKRLLLENEVAWPETFLLSGFSQGAHATLAAQQLLESESSTLKVSASAPVAAAIDLRNEGFKGALSGKSKFGSLYLGWIALTYSRDYDLPLSDLISNEWLETVLQVFDGLHSGDVIVETLPANPRELMHPDVLRAFDEMSAHPFLDRLEQNGLVGYEPRAPVRLYFGERDVDVTPAQARLLKGENVQTINLGALDHEQSILAAAPLLRDWFDEML